MRPMTRLISWTTTAALVAVAGAVSVHHARVVAGPAVVPPGVTPAPTLALLPPPEPGPTPAVPRAGRMPSVLSLDGHDTAFPAANLTVTRGRGGLHAVLCTDDPAAAMRSGYTANSFMFDMVVPVDNVTELPGSTWTYTDDASDATGIYLRGNRDQLQPTADVRVAFRHDKATTLAIVTGTFLRLDTRDPTAPPERVGVYGVLRCLPAQK